MSRHQAVAGAIITLLAIGLGSMIGLELRGPEWQRKGWSRPPRAQPADFGQYTTGGRVYRAEIMSDSCFVLHWSDYDKNEPNGRFTVFSHEADRPLEFEPGKYHEVVMDGHTAVAVKVRYQEPQK